jgi:small subunit ribosomal protein S7
MEKILTTLRTAPAPSRGDKSPLLTDTSIATSKTTSPLVDRTALPLSPIQYLTAVVDSVAPLVKIRQQKGMLGGGQNMPIPVPLRVKQRRRAAIKWIIETSQKRTEPALADRIAREVMAVAGGGSGVWEKRGQVHRLAITARSNIRQSLQRRK